MFLNAPIPRKLIIFAYRLSQIVEHAVINVNANFLHLKGIKTMISYAGENFEIFDWNILS